MHPSSATYPRLFPAPEQTIAGIGRMLRRRDLSCLDILETCLEQVDRWESRVHAWVVVDREGARQQARALEEELRKGRDRGPLHGIPIGIKDIIDVKGFPTACGVERRGDGLAEKDADVVTKLREAGAVILGKTVTTPHAWIDPPPTRNPWNLDRTPGGSSSGSAAAVSTGMCYGAIGSQTGGSITRPSSFCGVAGLKPYHGMISTTGVAPLARSLDHVGPIARSVQDLHSLFKAIVQFPFPGAEETQRQAVAARPPRIGRPRGFFDRRADPAVTSAFEEAVQMIGGRGAEIVDLDDPIDFEAILRDHRVVMAAEAAAVHFESLETNPEDYPPRIRDLILEGRSIRGVDYIRAGSRSFPAAFELRSALEKANICCLITPATVTTATDPSTTGDPAFNSPWSYLHLPTISFPTALASDAMPVAIQLVGHLLGEHALSFVGRWCEEAVQTWQP